LTSRETDLLQLIAEGYANKQIVVELNISIKTIKKHRQHLMERLNTMILPTSPGSPLQKELLKQRAIDSCVGIAW
jgi:FixJ family two-component response regulator